MNGKRTRRQPTAAQKEAAAHRRALARKLAKKVSALTPEQRAAMAAQMPVVSIEGNPLSPYNTCMIISQSEAATVVGGFRQWKKAGRHVQKGQKGMAIWCPSSKKATDDDGPQADDDTDDSPRFFLGTVFDVSQTAEKATPA
jgi:antirestriction protein ArdC|tara:strand:+ start:339 stop:764 length:426 start_codon:yes stop_codon:yes gene_type:complete